MNYFMATGVLVLIYHIFVFVLDRAKEFMGDIL